MLSVEHRKRGRFPLIHGWRKAVLKTELHMALQIRLTSVLVEDQEKALHFYTSVLGFMKKTDISMGEARWLTVGQAGNTEIELLLEPNVNPAGKVFQQSLHGQGTPSISFAVNDIDAEYERLVEAGVQFQGRPVAKGNIKVAIFDDTCGNLVQIYQM